MPFNPTEKKLLKQAPKVGDATIKRLESIGIDNFNALRSANATDICKTLSVKMNQPRLLNCPLARTANQNAIDVARKHV